MTTARQFRLAGAYVPPHVRDEEPWPAVTEPEPARVLWHGYCQAVRLGAPPEIAEELLRQHEVAAADGGASLGRLAPQHEPKPLPVQPEGDDA